jgi:hypothetical protein
MRRSHDLKARRTFAHAARSRDGFIARGARLARLIPLEDCLMLQRSLAPRGERVNRVSADGLSPRD